jgi:hypothetical protein
MPGYWMDEVTGQLRPVVAAYLTGLPMTARDIAVMRVYLRQWIEDGWWLGPMVDVLRTQVNEITTRDDIRRWLDRAMEEDIDPL